MNLALNRLKNKPEDLIILLNNIDKQPWKSLTGFSLDLNIDCSRLEGYRLEDGVDQQTTFAYQAMFKDITFIGGNDEGAYIGYWHGPEVLKIFEPPIIELDNEGQFYIKGYSITDYLLSVVNDEDFNELKSLLLSLGLPVKFDSLDKFFTSLEGINHSFRNPRYIYDDLLNGKTIQNLDHIPFGKYKFPEASKVLNSQNIKGITKELNIEEVITSLGENYKQGGGTNSILWGYVNPWLSYNYEDFNLRFEFNKSGEIESIMIQEFRS